MVTIAAGAATDVAPPLEDWGRLIEFRPGVVLRPASVDELKDMLERIDRGELGRAGVRVPGSLHSCSEIAVSDTIIDVGGLPKSIAFDAGDAAVTATANVTLREFLLELSAHGKSLTATGGTDAQTLAGLVSTGTAPATPSASLYELLEWLEVVSVALDGRAVERRIARGDPEFGAVVCSLGLLGVLTRVRFNLVDERFFSVVQKVVHLDDVLADLDATSQMYDFWRINWMPKSDKALLWAARRVPRDQAAPDGDYPDDSAEHVLEVVSEVLDKVGVAGPLLTGPLELVYKLLEITYKELHVTGPLRTMLPVDRRAPLRVAMAEWSFRPQDVNRVVGACQAYFEAQGWPNVPTEIELTRVDASLMSPWNWDGLDYIVKFNFMYLTEVCRTSGEKDGIYAHLRGLWDHLIGAGIAFKAHWGKVNFTDPESARTDYHLDAFRPSICPLFMNDYLRQRIDG